MARQVNGHLGTFASIEALTAKFPPSESIGCSANVGTTIPYTKAWCDGSEWALVQAPQIQALVSGGGILGGTQYPGALVTDWGAAGVLTTTGSTGTAFAAALDTAVLCNGKPALKLTPPNDLSAQTLIATWTPTNPLRLRDVQSIQIPVLLTALNGTNNDYTTLKVWLQTSDAKSIRLSMSGIITGYQSGVWQTFSISRGAAAVTQDAMSSLDTAGVTVTSIKAVIATTASGTVSPVWIGEVRADVKRTPGRVCIVMDGEYISQYSQIFPVMQSLGLVGSLAITGTDIGTSNSGYQRMTASQISEMYAAGWECIHHTYDGTKQNGYVNSTDWTTAALIAEDVRANWALFRTNGWLRGIGFGVWGWAYAFTSSQTQARQQLVRDGLRAGGLLAMRKGAPFNGENNTVLAPIARMPVDPLVIHGAIQVTSTDTSESIIAAIDAAEARGELAIITLHRSVADTATPGSLEMRIGQLTTAMQHLAQRAAAGGIAVEPFGATVSRMYGSSMSA